MQPYDVLKKVPLFAGLPEADLEHLCQEIEEVRLAAGEELFAEGGPGDRAYVVTIIYNNQVHFATKRSLTEEYPESYSARTNNWVGMELSPSVDFATLAQACRAYGEIVEEPSQVIPSLERALQEVKGGRTAVLDVRIERP